jgi:hypothetical protein
VQVGRDPHDLANLKLYMAMRRDVDDWKGAADTALEDQPGFGAIREARRDGNNPHKVSCFKRYSYGLPVLIIVNVKKPSRYEPTPLPKVFSGDNVA